MKTRTAGDIQNSTEQLLEDLKTVVKDGEELLQAGAENLSAEGVASRQKLAAALEVARETKRRLEARAMAGAEAADRVVRANPYQALGIAFGAGLLLGVIVNRK